MPRSSPIVSALSATAAALLVVASICGASPVATQLPPSSGFNVFQRRPTVDLSGLPDSLVQTLWRNWDRAYKAEVCAMIEKTETVDRKVLAAEAGRVFKEDGATLPCMRHSSPLSPPLPPPSPLLQTKDVLCSIINKSNLRRTRGEGDGHGNG
jgi:hypothetical protein